MGHAGLLILSEDWMWEGGREGEGEEGMEGGRREGEGEEGREGGKIFCGAVQKRIIEGRGRKRR